VELRRVFRQLVHVDDVGDGAEFVQVVEDGAAAPARFKVEQEPACGAGERDRVDGRVHALKDIGDFAFHLQAGKQAWKANCEPHQTNGACCNRDPYAGPQPDVRLGDPAQPALVLARDLQQLLAEMGQAAIGEALVDTLLERLKRRFDAISVQ
jgi:hypothetical protein